MKTPNIDAVLEAFIVLAREGIHIKAMTFDRRDFLRLAVDCQVDQPEEPLQDVGARPDYCDAGDPMSKHPCSVRTVRVGKSFTLHGPFGPVVIECGE